jgi:hypothetical protein
MKIYAEIDFCNKGFCMWQKGNGSVYGRLPIHLFRLLVGTGNKFVINVNKWYIYVTNVNFTYNIAKGGFKKWNCRIWS